MIPVTLMMATTLDGKIAKNGNHFPDWTSTEDKKLFAKVSKEYGVMMFGEKTFNTFPAPLKDRLHVVFTNKVDLPEQKDVKYVSGDIGQVLADLESEGHTKVLLGGGCFLNTLFLKEKLINKIIITIEPKLFGDGISLFGGDFDIDLDLENVEKINHNSIVVTYNVKY